MATLTTVLVTTVQILNDPVSNYTSHPHSPNKLVLLSQTRPLVPVPVMAAYPTPAVDTPVPMLVVGSPPALDASLPPERFAASLQNVRYVVGH